MLLPDATKFTVPLFLGVDIIASGDNSPMQIVESGVAHTLESIFCGEQ